MKIPKEIHRTKKQTYSLVSQVYPKSVVAEAYRTLRTNLGFASPDNPCRSLLVTSPGPEDGKSTTAANLAVVLAQAGHKLLLVDCDLRKPTMHKYFELENACGLTNLLLQGGKILSFTQQTQVPNLLLLTTGPLPPNPAELLGSDKLRGLWAEQLKSFDYILVDSPPVLAVTDASLLATQLQGVILVVESGSTRVDIVKDAKAQLAKASANVIGVVLNRVKMGQKDYHYYYYYRRTTAAGG